MWTSAVPLPHARADQQSIDRGSWVLCQEIALEASTIQQLSGQPDATEQPFSQPDAGWVDAFVSAIKGTDSRFQRQSQRGSSARTLPAIQAEASAASQDTFQWAYAKKTLLSWRPVAVTLW